MQNSRGRLGRLLVGAAVIAATGMTVPTAAIAAPVGATGPTETYLVLFKGSSSPADAAAMVTAAGGVVVADYSKIGVLVASSGNSAFDETLRANNLKILAGDPILRSQATLFANRAALADVRPFLAQLGLEA